MTKFIATAALFAALVSQAAGHTAVTEFEANGKKYPGFRQASKQDPGNKSPAWWTNQGWGWTPIFGDKINHPDIIAHANASPSPHTAEAPAGSKVTFTWFHEGQCKNDEVGWDCSHHGFTATYLAPCNGDCAKVDKTELEFFKIHEAGLIDYREGRYSSGGPKESTGYWGTDAIFYGNNNKQSVTIPKSIPNGNYVLRTEVMSIHNNGPIKDRQFWPQAFNIKVTGGSSSAKMPAGKKGTELYKSSDELLNFDLYWHDAKKIPAVPGPKVISAAANSNGRRDHPRDFSS